MPVQGRQAFPCYCIVPLPLRSHALARALLGAQPLAGFQRTSAPKALSADPKSCTLVNPRPTQLEPRQQSLTGPAGGGRNAAHTARPATHSRTRRAALRPLPATPLLAATLRQDSSLLTHGVARLLGPEHRAQIALQRFDLPDHCHGGAGAGIRGHGCRSRLRGAGSARRWPRGAAAQRRGSRSAGERPQEASGGTCSSLWALMRDQQLLPAAGSVSLPVQAARRARSPCRCCSPRCAAAGSSPLPSHPNPGCCAARPPHGS